MMVAIGSDRKSIRLLNTNSLVILFSVVACLIAGTLISEIRPSRLSIVFLILGLVITGSFGVRVLRARWDPFDPLYFSLIAFALLFFVRPLADHLDRKYTWVSINIEPYFLEAMTSVLVAVISFTSIYLFAGNIKSPMYLRPPRLDNPSTVLVGSYLLMIYGIGSRTVLAQAAGGLQTLLQRREAASTDAIGIPFLWETMWVVIPAFLLFTVTVKHYPVWSAIGMGGCLLVIGQSLYAGSRRQAIIFIVAVFSFWYIRRAKRPSVISLTIVSLLGWFLVIAPIEISRSGEIGYADALVLSLRAPFSQVDNLLIESQSTSMVAAFAMEIGELGSDGSVPYRYGLSTLTETVLQPIPQQIWPAKPEPTRNLLIQELWGMENNGCVSLCPTFSALGTFYADFGLLSVALGSGLCGMFFRKFYDFFCVNSRNPFVQVAFSCCVFTPFFLWWGGLSVVTISLIIYILPALTIGFFSENRKK